MNDLARTMRVASLALGYPDAAWRSQLPLMTEAAAGSALMLRFLDAVRGCAPGELELEYTATFDLRRRCCPYLTYYSHGDTRKRGMALLRFTAAYRAAGFTLCADELPDHIAVLCEFTAWDPRPGLALFRQHRAGVELLRTALEEAGSPWLYVVDAVRAVLPDPAPRDLDRALELARTGPPAEEVGLW